MKIFTTSNDGDDDKNLLLHAYLQACTRVMRGDLGVRGLYNNSNDKNEKYIVALFFFISALLTASCY